MNKLMNIFFLFLFSMTVQSQCPVDDVVLISQQDLIDFHLLYPDCKTLEYNLTIEGPDISDLRPLDSIEVIAGELNIFNNEDLDSINGLSNLRRIESNLSIKGNFLWSMEGLSNLEYIGGDFEYFYNQNGVLNGLLSLDSIVGTLHFHQILFSNFNYMNNVEHIGGGLKLTHCNVNQLNGLSKIKSLGGDLRIVNCPYLTNLTGLDGLEKMDGELVLENNEKLKSISALDQIDYTSIKHLKILNNSELSICHIESVCNYLYDDGDHLIDKNDFGCESKEQVWERCGFSNKVQIAPKEIELFPNPGRDHFVVKLEGSELVKFKLYNNLGSLVKTGEFRNSYRLDMYNAIKGTYYLNLSSDDWSRSLKLINL